MNQATQATLPLVIDDPRQIRATVERQRKSGKKIGLVPTMGALHEGHLSLVRASTAECDCTVVSVFVNPAQFGPQEDLRKYPRTWEADLLALEECGVDLVFAPRNEAIYPPGFSTYVEPPRVAKRWEGACRPGHFRGVATVVLKLFQLVPAHAAYFGQKDYQQSLVVRRMVADLNLPIDVQVLPIVREADGLALSSRNQYLGDEERRQATALSSSLDIARQLVEQGTRDARSIEGRMRQVLDEAGISQIDYIAVADPETLEPVERITSRAVVLLAARVGETRLIDNQLIG